MKRICPVSGVSIGFHFGGGGGFKFFFGKSGGICMALRVMQRVAKPRVAKGVWGHGPSRKFLKWCNLVRFEEYFAKVL